jgi:hypothetical protein
VTLDQYMRDAFDYWEGAFSFIDDDAPDGSWWQQHEDVATYHTTDHEVRGCLAESGDLPPEDADANDIVHAYLAEKARRQESGGDE